MSILVGSKEGHFRQIPLHIYMYIYRLVNIPKDNSYPYYYCIIYFYQLINYERFIGKHHYIERDIVILSTIYMTIPLTECFV